MTRWLTRAALGATLLLAPALVLAGSGDRPDPEQVAAHLTERMGLDPATAEEVAAIALATREEGEQLKAAAATQAEALRGALEAGETAAMESAMSELLRIQADAQALQDATQGDIRALLTTEQRARWTLHHLHKRSQREEAMHHLEALRELSSPEARQDRVPHFRSE